MQQDGNVLFDLRSIRLCELENWAPAWRNGYPKSAGSSRTSPGLRVHLDY